MPEWILRKEILMSKYVYSLSFIYSAMYIGIMLVVDLLYGIIDPRIRLAKGDD